MDEQLVNKAQEESMEKQMAELEDANKAQSEEVEDIQPIDSQITESDQEKDNNDSIVAEEEKEEKTEKVSVEEESEIKALSREELVNRLEAIYKDGILPASKTLVALIRVTYKERTEDWKKLIKEQLEAEKENKTDTVEDKSVEENGNISEIQESQSGRLRFIDTFEERFSEISRKIKEFHAKEREEREKLMALNLDRKKVLLEELKGLIDSDQPLKQTYDAFSKLTETWKEIKPIAREEANNLWQNYHFLVEKFFDKVKMNNELRTLDQKKNLEEKIKLCEKAEELILEESISKAAQQLHELHRRWKELGQVSIEMKDEIWERFKAASDKISAKRKAYYDEMDAKFEQNLLAKTELCEKMEDILKEMPADTKSWNEQNKQVEELMSLWKSIGRAPEKENDAIWERFRSGMQSFFDNKKAFYQQMKDEQMQNYNLKVDLCAKAENIAEQRLDWRVATQEILKIQKQWKEIGAVPYRLSEKVWKRFRSACDTFFNKKAEHYEQMKGQEGGNVELKRQLIEDVKKLSCENRSELVKSIQEIQRKWAEIGFVPIKDKESLYTEFREAIDAKFSDKNLKGAERWGVAGLVASIETAEDAAKLSNKEVRFIADKIAQLRSDLQTWENNMGFLSQSKNSEVLRQEVERKMQKAKQELALMEAKLKLIQNK